MVSLHVLAPETEWLDRVITLSDALAGAGSGGKRTEGPRRTPTGPPRGDRNAQSALGGGQFGAAEHAWFGISSVNAPTPEKWSIAMWVAFDGTFPYSQTPRPP